MSDPTDRRVFAYFDGRARVHGDPYRLQRRLALALGGELGQVLDDAESPDDAVALAALGRLFDGVREAFGLVPFDPATGEGATEQDCRRALDGLDAFFAPAASPSGSPPTSPPSTVPAS